METSNNISMWAWRPNYGLCESAHVARRALAPGVRTQEETQLSHRASFTTLNFLNITKQFTVFPVAPPVPFPLLALSHR